MKVFEWKPDEFVKHVDPVEPGSDSFLITTKRQSLANGWSGMKFSETLGDDGFSGKFADCLSMRPNLRMVSRKATEALSPALQESGELLPVTVDGADREFIIFNCQRIVDCLYKKRTEGNLLTRFPRRYSHISRFSFDKEQLCGEIYVFILPEYRTYLVTEQFVDKVNEHGLSGFHFTALG